MATADDTKQRAADALEHRKIYDGIMKASTHVGVPFSMALAMFFTQLAMRNGVIIACISFVAVYIFAWWIVRTFFTSH